MRKMHACFLMSNMLYFDRRIACGEIQAAPLRIRAARCLRAALFFGLPQRLDERQSLPQQSDNRSRQPDGENHDIQANHLPPKR